MKSYFRSNLDNRGRLIRGIGAFGQGIAAVIALPHSRIAAVALGIAAAFVAFEAAKGWCVLRACGLKTRF